MANDIDRLFASLSADADSTPVMPAATLRGRTNRRAAARAGLAGVALVAVVAGTTFGGQWLLVGQADPTVLPGGGVSATTPPPTVAIPASIPLQAFLSKSDLNDDVGPVAPSAERAPLPSFCGAEFTDTVGVRRVLRAQFRPAGTPRTDTPAGVVRQTVTVHRAGGAERFMADLRAAVGGCPAEDSLQVVYRLIDPVGVGDDAIRIEERYTRGTAGFTQQISVVRVGDAVTVLWTSGYENESAVDATVVALTRAAHDNLANWRK